MNDTENNVKDIEAISEVPKRVAWLVHGIFIVLIIAGAYWVYTGSQPPKESQELPQTSAAAQTQSAYVNSNDEAVKGFLLAAKQLAEVYRYTNGGSFQGLCEFSDTQQTLEGESGGILKYIKFVGATEVFCSTADEFYLIEAKMPENGNYFCIDPMHAVEQTVSRQGSARCQ